MITDGILEQPRSELFGDGSFEQGTRYGVGRVGSGATKVTGPGFGGPNNPRTEIYASSWMAEQGTIMHI